jgi:hypothetical protein
VLIVTDSVVSAVVDVSMSWESFWYMMIERLNYALMNRILAGRNCVPRVTVRVQVFIMDNY